jgi:hypothetical protein
VRAKAPSPLGAKLSPDDFTVKVLTTGYWPTYTQLDVRLPADMLACINVRAYARAELYICVGVV